MLDRITGMQVFMRVAAERGFAPAARSLGLSQTMVTKHIAALEQRLGVRLLHRSTRQMTLSEAGRQFLAACERIVAEVEEAEASAAADRFEPRGLLRVNVPLTFGLREIAPLVPEFARRYPAVTIDLGLNDRFVDLIAEEWDLAIRIGRLKDSSLVARRLAGCRMVLCASPAYLSAHGTPTLVSDLADHNCLTYTLSSSNAMDRWPFGKNGESSVAVSGNLRANNGDALRAAALAGQGMIYQPTFIVADDLIAGRLVEIGLDRPPIELAGVYAVFASGRQPPAKVRAFVEFLAEAWIPQPPWEAAVRPARRLEDG
jgi:DNA-binding transcriptional LysR family regulator